MAIWQLCFCLAGECAQLSMSGSRNEGLDLFMLGIRQRHGVAEKIQQQCASGVSHPDMTKYIRVYAVLML